SICYEPSSYRDYLNCVCRREGIRCTGEIEGFVGLRNLLIHRYLVIDDKCVYDSIKGVTYSLLGIGLIVYGLFTGNVPKIEIGGIAGLIVGLLPFS
ncbi:MAG TPA: DUF86 domain-containing protein, partial [Candidatus Korarchaeota archaeon]|nr:DUF86 domain-containing protein [Candidatus Korarchaeota archaeon]